MDSNKKLWIAFAVVIVCSFAVLGGVGVKLIDCMKAVGRERGLAYLFACTTQERVGQFFERQGFREVPQADAPPGKWVGYDDRRRRGLWCYRFDL